MSEELVMRQVRDLTNSDVLALVAKSDQYMSALYPPESNHAEPLAALVGEDSAFFAGATSARNWREAREVRGRPIAAPSIEPLPKTRLRGTRPVWLV